MQRAPFAISSSAPRASHHLRRLGSPGAPRRGAAWGIILLILVVVLVVLIGRAMREQSANEDAGMLRDSMTDPKTTLTSYFIARGQNYDRRDVRWHRLMQYMSDDDQHWLDANLPTLIGLAGGDAAGGAQLAAAMSGDEERRYTAVMWLLHVSLDTPRPIVSTIQQHGEYAAVFIQDPFAGETLRPVFLVNEMGSWKIRRFLGDRDRPAVMDAVIAAKKKEGRPLDDDEKLYQLDPDQYLKRMQTQLYEQAGFKPEDVPGGAAEIPKAKTTGTTMTLPKGAAATPSTGR